MGRFTLPMVGTLSGELVCVASKKAAERVFDVRKEITGALMGLVCRTFPSGKFLIESAYSPCRIAAGAWLAARNSELSAPLFLYNNLGSSPSDHCTRCASALLPLSSTANETTYAFSTLISAPEPQACSIQKEIVFISAVCEISSMDLRINQTSSAELTSMAKECTSAGIGAPICCSLTSAAMHSSAFRAFTVAWICGGASLTAIRFDKACQA
mmetsp:Transcript_114411/g.178761  ORF Transcript_114411/g.178761 Transcript_114411/m.178761 type:complete len:213 (+) Transcript_114411:1478-2116(+)